MMNILFISGASSLGGAEVCLVRLLKNLDRKRFHPFLIAPEPGPIVYKAEEIKVTTTIISMVGLKTFNAWKFVRNFIVMIKSIFQLRKIIIREKISVVHGFTLRTYEQAILASLISHVPCVGTLHDPLTDEHVGKWRKKLTVFLVNNLLKILIVPSEATRQIAIKAGVHPDKVRTVHNGIDVADFGQIPNIKSSFNPSGVIKVGVVGRLTQNKGIDCFISAINICSPRVEKLEAIVVGGIPDESNPKHISFYQYITDLVKRFNLEKKIVFTGWRKDVNSLMSSFDILVLPSVYPDPFPTVILEAMVLNKPVIAFNVGGASELIEDNVSGVLVPPKDIDALAEAIVRLSTDPQLREAMGTKGYSKLTHQFSIEKHTQKIQNIYQEVGV